VNQRLFLKTFTHAAAGADAPLPTQPLGYLEVLGALVDWSVDQYGPPPGVSGILFYAGGIAL
jgi:hypothetical protein